MSEERKLIYLNRKQLEFVNSEQKRKIFIGGRGSGKSTVGGVESFIRFAKLPRSKGFIAGLTYNQILTKFLPPMEDQWRGMGMQEHVHYVVGRKPPASWRQPFQPPRKYENVISTFTGACLEMISMDRKDAQRGGNYDYGIFDEAVLIDKERHDKEISPMIRGNIYRYPETHLHHSKIYLSSQSWLPRGDWVPEMGNQRDTFYMESTVYDNMDVLGKKYIEEQERDTPWLIFQVEFLNKRIKKLPNSFYDYLDEKHFYYDSYNYSNDDAGMLVTGGDKDYDPEAPLSISFDFGGNITLMTVHQEKGLEDRQINEFYEKKEYSSSESLIDAVVRKFCNEYKGHRNMVLVYGDRNGNNKQANSELTYYEQILRMLRANKFNCELMVRHRLDPFHQLKHFVVNQLLRENDKNLPRIRINQNKCKCTIISLQSTPITADFKKDKSSEKDTSLPQEKATHFSDAFDNYYVVKYQHLFPFTQQEEAEFW